MSKGRAVCASHRFDTESRVTDPDVGEVMRSTVDRISVHATGTLMSQRDTVFIEKCASRVNASGVDATGGRPFF